VTRLQQIYIWTLWRMGNMGVTVNDAELQSAWIPTAKEIHKKCKPAPAEIQSLLLGMVLERVTFHAKDEASRLRFNRSRDFKGLILGDTP
jgi:hypothetical protein